MSSIDAHLRLFARWADEGYSVAVAREVDRRENGLVALTLEVMHLRFKFEIRTSRWR